MLFRVVKDLDLKSDSDGLVASNPTASEFVLTRHFVTAVPDILPSLINFQSLHFINELSQRTKVYGVSQPLVSIESRTHFTTFHNIIIYMGKKNIATINLI